MYPAHYLYDSTTDLCGVWTEATNCEGITKPKRNAGKCTNTSSGFCSTWPSQIHMYCTNTTEQTHTIPFKEFRSRLADLLIGDYCSRKRPGRPCTTQHPPVQLLHVPVKRMDGEEGSRTKRSKCLLCTRHKKRKDTCWSC